MQEKLDTNLRLQNLDVLRAVALMLVLIKHFFHLTLSTADLHSLQFLRPLMRAGFIGVPIFFVLSGFLIGRLLFMEFSSTGTLKLGRFWIRRGFKIYPTFYFAIFAYSAYLIFIEGHIDWVRFMCEIFFVQNYGKGGLFEVTWSLAVEEHFYIIFPLFLLALIKFRRKAELIPRQDPVLQTFRPIVWITAGLMVICLLLRIEATLTIPPRGRGILMTHLRIDALFAGAAVAFLYQVGREQFTRWFSKFPVSLLVIAVVLTYPAFLPEITYSRAFYLGVFPLVLTFASILMLGVSVATPDWLGHFGRALAWLGKYSYGIYLCHVPLYRVMNKAAAWLPERPHVYIWLLLALTLACLGGVVVTRLVEMPFLKLRERFYPRIVR